MKWLYDRIPVGHAGDRARDVGVRTLAAARSRALALVAAAPAARRRRRFPASSTVALSLPSPGLQAGSVQGTKVVFARGSSPSSRARSPRGSA